MLSRPSCRSALAADKSGLFEPVGELAKRLLGHLGHRGEVGDADAAKPPAAEFLHRLRLTRAMIGLTAGAVSGEPVPC